MPAKRPSFRSSKTSLPKPAAPKRRYVREGDRVAYRRALEIRSQQAQKQQRGPGFKPRRSPGSGGKAK